MKKLFLMFLLSGFVFAFTSCGGSTKTESEGDQTEDQTEAVDQSATEADTTQMEEENNESDSTATEDMEAEQDTTASEG